ncbi:ABC transporter ATP-binding protein [Hydrogenoanaerobacterium sp.]|uniref:energy-coupling factor ABC transporter ATP-binding protein n=1 Tax=Hydrogenoanaerobacterium sp. TaxID=2953763 RepID=UPI002899D867|nr:ABC transporter ATP-binding protein [Hydrogenoanaerobacterium sp.]
MAYISLKDVSFEYPGGFLAVDNISLEIEKGENVAIVGQNGAGKTTTVKMLNGLHKPTKGDVLIGDMNTKDHTTAQVSRVVGYVFQNPDDQIFHSTVLSEVEFGPKTLKFDEEKKNKLIDYALELTGLTQFKDENPYNLPLSVRKFVTIASIIAMDDEVMIFDEPTAGQDLTGTRRLSSILKTLHESGKTVITITHDMEFVVQNFKRVIVMANKKVVVSGSPQEIFWNMEALKEAMLKQPYISRLCRQLAIGDGVIKLDDAIDAICAVAQGQVAVP